MAGTAFGQEKKLLQWNQLMDRKLYPQREMSSFIFAPDGKTVTYYKGGEDKGFYGFDGKKEFELSEEQQDWRKPKSHDPKLEERVELKEGKLYVDGKLVERGDGYNIVLGESVHRNEFGINGGLFWSPKQSRLAFYRMDQSMVEDYPIVDTKAREAEVRNIKYPMAGMKSHEVTVGVWDCTAEKLVYLNTARDTTVHEREMYLTNIAWSPDEKSIYVGVLNREQNHLQMRRYNAATGKFEKLLFEEKNDRYVEPQHPLTFLPNDPEKFIYWSRKDGFWHLYLYNIDGKQISQITKGDFEVQEIYGFANKNQDLIINANKETPIDFTIYKVNIASGNMTLISGNSGTGKRLICHSVSLITFFLLHFPIRFSINHYTLFLRGFVGDPEKALFHFNFHRYLMFHPAHLSVPRHKGR